jgi:hypothetical protein
MLGESTSNTKLRTTLIFCNRLVFLTLALSRTGLESPVLLVDNQLNLLGRLNGCEGNEFLLSKAWTNEEIMSILRLKGLTEQARDNIASMLYQIKGEDSLERGEKSIVEQGEVIPTEEEKYRLGRKPRERENPNTPWESGYLLSCGDRC